SVPNGSRDQVDKRIGVAYAVNLGMAKIVLMVTLSCSGRSFAQSIGAGTLKGTITDVANARIPSADVDLRNPITGYSKQTRTGTDGSFVFTNVPPNRYELRASLAGFRSYRTEVTVQTAVPLTLAIQLELASQQQSITVEGSQGAMLETKTASSDIV